jgi:hypothetical protein
MGTDKAYGFEDADVIVRTPCSKAFPVHKGLLSVASPVFRDMVAALSSPSRLTLDDDESLPEIDVDDAAEDMDFFLRLIYPIPLPPKLDDFDSLSRAFAILRKYKVAGVEALLKPIIVSSSFLGSDPVRAYAMACRLGFEEEVKVAAPLAAATDFPMKIRKEDLRKMDGVDYHRLTVISKERLKKSKSDIFAAPLQCDTCPQAFYTPFRQKLADKLLTEEVGRFYDTMECLDLCFTVSKDCGAVSCSGVGGDMHFEKFVFALVKELQKPPAYFY